jgi:cyclic beta-1,2-glucan synthetase
MLLLSTLSAHDFGYIGTYEFVERTEPTFATLDKLSRPRGHFLNWYDTRTLQPLHPQYISTVDSGNLAGHLIALKQACIELPDVKLVDDRVVKGLSDTLEAISLEAAQIGASRQRTEIVTVRQLREEIAKCKVLLESELPDSLSLWFPLLHSLERHAAVIADIVGALAHEHGTESFKEMTWWVGAFARQVDSFKDDLHTLTPWTASLAALHATASMEPGEFAATWREIVEPLNAVPTLGEIPELLDTALVRLAALQGDLGKVPPDEGKHEKEISNRVATLTAAVERAAEAARDLLSRSSKLANHCERIFQETDFSFLFDEERKLFPIGYNVTDLRPDNSYYDLLASEARLASFIAIAKGDIPQEHWFRMGRQLTSVDGGQALISWTGTMFEYLMPLLVMRNYEGTLLDQSYKAVVARQIEYGRERGVPWGISESAYNARDLQLNYQYGPFGVPGLGLKRGLIEDLVIAPYATLLAAMVRPREAMANLRLLAQDGAMGEMGFFEAIDYTTERLPQNQKRVLIRAFMTHHQGMSLVALNNALSDGRMEHRFHAEPLVQATELLLQERIPVGVVTAHPRAEEVLSGRVIRSEPGMVTRSYNTANLDTPRTQLLSNGTYHLMITTAGSGYSACGRNAVTRWREDVTRDNWGAFVYLRDVRSGSVWSAGYQPVQRRPQSYEVLFSEDKADFLAE